MSWSINFIGKPAAVAKAIEDESAKFTDQSNQSKVEFDAVKPHLLGIVAQNFADRGTAYVEPVLQIEASGSGVAQGGNQVQRSCTVKLQKFYGKLV